MLTTWEELNNEPKSSLKNYLKLLNLKDLSREEVIRILAIFKAIAHTMILKKLFLVMNSLKIKKMFDFYLLYINIHADENDFDAQIAKYSWKNWTISDLYSRNYFSYGFNAFFHCIVYFFITFLVRRTSLFILNLLVIIFWRLLFLYIFLF